MDDGTGESNLVDSRTSGIASRHSVPRRVFKGLEFALMIGKCHILSWRFPVEYYKFVVRPSSGTAQCAGRVVAFEIGC